MLALERAVWAPASEPVAAARVPAQEQEQEQEQEQVEEPVLASAARVAV